jgi:hypothetical protein
MHTIFRLWTACGIFVVMYVPFCLWIVSYFPSSMASLINAKGQVFISHHNALAELYPKDRKLFNFVRIVCLVKVHSWWWFILKRNRSKSWHMYLFGLDRRDIIFFCDLRNAYSIARPFSSTCWSNFSSKLLPLLLSMGEVNYTTNFEGSSNIC